jgi:hypothetical protein
MSNLFATEELETINVGNDQFKKELKIKALVTPEERGEMITLLHEYRCLTRICLVWIWIS